MNKTADYKFTIIVPVYNEAENMQRLEEALAAYLPQCPVSACVLFVDDGSVDGSGEAIAQICSRRDGFFHISFESNKGLSAALKAGFDYCESEWCGYMDSDLQTVPEDFNLLLEDLPHCSMVTGIRTERQDSGFKKLQSRIANGWRRMMTHDGALDTGCPLKVLHTGVAKKMPLFKGMHRFIPALVLLQEGGCYKQIPVRHFPRTAGKSKYHLWNRMWAPFVDCFAYRWMKSRSSEYKVKATNLLALLLVCFTFGSCVKTVYPEKYGFSPSADAATNTAALQKALDGGCRRVVLKHPGVYKMNNTVYIDSDTELLCKDGVVLRKDSLYCQMVVNRGALTREYNENIKVKGLTLSVFGYDVPPEYESCLFGLRAQLSFLCARNFTVEDYTCEDLGHLQYGIQVNMSDHFVIDGFVIRGDKDGVHLSSCSDFVVRNGICQTFDDCLALNASDWATSNCVDGDITDGLIENITDEKLDPHSGELCRLLTGAWVDWHDGITIRRSDVVAHNGRLYKAIAAVKDTTYISHCAPTIETFAGMEEEPAGFSWHLMRADTVYYSTNIRNITIRNVRGYSSRSAISEETFFSDGEWARNFHEEVTDPAKFPVYDNILVEDCDFSGNAFLFWRNDHAHSDVTFRRIKGIHHGFWVSGPVDPSVKNITRFEDCDFSANGDDYDFNIWNGGCVVTRGCTFPSGVRFKRREGTYSEE